MLHAAEPAAREAAWQRFLETHSPLLLHAARKLGRDYDAAMDAYAYLVEQLRSDDFHRLRAYSSDGRGKFTTWLVVVARRLCLDHLRQRYGRATDGGVTGRELRLVRRQLADLLADELDSTPLATETMADNPEIQFRANDLRHTVVDAVAALEPRDQLLLRLRFDDGLSAREIGRIMGFSTPFQVYGRLKTILAHLRLALRARGVEDPVP